MRLWRESPYSTAPPAWYSRPELNRDRRFRKPLLYPFELREPQLAHYNPLRLNCQKLHIGRETFWRPAESLK